MFGRYLEDHQQARTIMLPGAFVGTPTSYWYMATGIHLLHAGASDDPVVEALAFKSGMPAKQLVDQPTASESDVQRKMQTSENVDASDVDAALFARIMPFTLPGYVENAADVQSSLKAELVSTVTSNMANEKVKEWINDVEFPESTPDWISSEDEWSDYDEDKRTSIGDERTSVHDVAGDERTAMRQLAMSPSNLRPMTANYEASAPSKLEDKEHHAGKSIVNAMDDQVLAAMIEGEELLAQRIELMCEKSGERPVDVQAMYIHKLCLCPHVAPHDWSKCSYAHEGEIARRRDPATHSANPCSCYEKNQTCARADKCRFSHGVWERGLVYIHVDIHMLNSYTYTC
jgi:hypothetical protein